MDLDLTTISDPNIIEIIKALQRKIEELESELNNVKKRVTILEP